VLPAVWEEPWTFSRCLPDGRLGQQPP